MTTQLNDETKPTLDQKRRHAAKHGLAAVMFEARSFNPELAKNCGDAWMESLNPQDGSIEAYLIEQAVRISFRLERTDAGQKAMLFAALEELLAGKDDADEPIDRRNSPAEQIKLLIRYEMHSERTFARLIKDLSERAAYALQEEAEPQPISARNEPKVDPTPTPNEAKSESNSVPNEPKFAPGSVEETIANPLRPRPTDVNPPADPEYAAALRRMADRYSPRDAPKDRS